jgi:ribosomal protein L11 methyltransferase
VGLDGIELEGQRVLDFGSGSGILAIAALRLGAVSAVACDLDPQALAATRDNASRNRVLHALEITHDPGPPRGAFDVVLANILARTLVQLAATLAGHLAPGGRLLLSGILEDQVDAVVEAYRGSVTFDAPVVRDSWVRLTGTKT